MVAGIVDHETGTRDIRKLGGLFTFMPITATLALFGTFSMAGIPLPFLNGFYSKEMFFDSTLTLNEGTHAITSFLTTVIPYLAVFGSIFTFVYSMYLFFGVFGKNKQNLPMLPKKPHEAPIGMLISPFILVLGVVLIGLMPNVFGQSLLTHAAEAINGIGEYAPIKFWHGFDSIPLVMSLIVVGVGAILALTRVKWEKVYEFLPGSASINRVYNWLMDKLDTYSERITKSYMVGSVRVYMSIILATIVIVTFIVMYLTNGFAIAFDNLADVTIIEVTIVVVIMSAAIGTILSKNNLAAILVLGIVGYSVAMLFVIYRAPDLALTQLVIETITVALFLLCFYHLPNLYKTNESTGVKISNVVISAGFGLLLAMLGISAHSSKWFDTISDYFVETSLPIGGGHNIVNVILVDMRGIDTLFEITVLGIAGLAIYSLIKIKNKKEAK